MQKFYGKVTDTNGIPVAGARLTVRTANVITPLPPLLSENGDGTLSSASNPILTDQNGEYSFVVAPGDYTLSATGTSDILNIGKTIIQYVPVTVTTGSGSSSSASTFNQLIITSTSSWTVPDNISAPTVTCVGAGGGGGGGRSSGLSGGGGAGGSGGATVKRELPVLAGQIFTVTIGAKGTGGSAGNPGNAGGNTTFGTLVQANGGNGGGASTGTAGGIASTPGNGTLVGLGGGASITLTSAAIPIIYGSGAAVSGGIGGNGGNGAVGGDGLTGTAIETFPAGSVGVGDAATSAGGGSGGASAYGKGGNGGGPGSGGATAPPALNYGAGGGGGGHFDAGADGSNGLCIVEWIS